MNEFTLNTELMIVVNTCDYGIRTIDAKVTRITDKAIQVSNKHGFCYFPKSALQKDTESLYQHTYTIKKWFTLNDFQVKMSEFYDIPRIKESIESK